LISKGHFYLPPQVIFEEIVDEELEELGNVLD